LPDPPWCSARPTSRASPRPRRTGRRAARAELERGLEAKRAEALERAAESLAELLASRRREAAGARDQAIALAAAIAGAVATDPDVAETVGAALEAVPGAPTIRVLVDELAAAPLRARAPGIAARAGFAGSIEIVADPRLTPGSVRVVGAGGWLEHDPARVRERVAAALAAHRPTGTKADEPSAETTHAPPENGDDHDDR
jgi:flagellar biosynthesis/type III secretory pathway protein FliH